MAALAALPALQTISTIATVGATAVSALGTIASGRAQEAAAEFQAKQLDIKQNEEFAAGQREASQLARQKRLALSKLTNQAAGSGFSTADPSTLAIQDEITKYGTYQEDLARYGGASRAEGARLEAAAKRFEGTSAKSGSYLTAAGTILGGASTLADKYDRYRTKSAAPAGGSAAWDSTYG